MRIAPLGALLMLLCGPARADLQLTCTFSVDVFPNNDQEVLAAEIIPTAQGDRPCASIQDGSLRATPPECPPNYAQYGKVSDAYLGQTEVTRSVRGRQIVVTRSFREARRNCLAPSNPGTKR